MMSLIYFSFLHITYHHIYLFKKVTDVDTKHAHLSDHYAFHVGQFLENVEVLWEFLLLFRIQRASNACSLMVVQHQAIDSLLSSRASFSGLAEATRRRRCALQAVGILLQMPHTYQARSNQKSICSFGILSRIVVCIYEFIRRAVVSHDLMMVDLQ